MASWQLLKCAPVFSARVCEYVLALHAVGHHWWRQFLQFQLTCSIMVLFYVQTSLEYVRLRALHGFLETMHIYITAVTLVYWLRMSSWRFNIGCMSWDLFLNFIFVLAISNCSFMPSIKVLEAHAHMVFFGSVLRFVGLHFCNKHMFIYNVSFTALDNCSSARAVCGDHNFPLHTHIPFCEYFFSTCTLQKNLNLYRII